jgi:16S rRNA processing protein RimM
MNLKSKNDNESNFTLVGKITEAHGIKGEFKVFIFSKNVSWSNKLKTVYLDKTNREYEVEMAKPFKEGLRLKLKGIDDRTLAETYKGAMLSIAKELLVSKKGETIFLKEILHFELLDESDEGLQKSMGKIFGFSSNGPQDLLLVNVETKELKGEVAVPFVEAFIKEIDFKNQKVIMNLPEGLIESQLSSGE